MMQNLADEPLTPRCKFNRSRCVRRSNLTEKNRKAESGKSLAKPLVRRSERLGVNARLAGDGHKIRVTNPAWKRVQMKVAGHACACRASKIHSIVHAIWPVQLMQDPFDSLRELHELTERRSVTEGKLCHVCVRHDHHMTGRVRIKIQNYKAGNTTMNNQSDIIVVPRDSIAKNTFRLFTGDGLRNVLVAPRCPQKIHRVSVLFK